MIFQTKKLYDGFSCCFRQWKAEGTHCKFLHGYGISFEITFEGELDHRNWVADFGLFKRARHTIQGHSVDGYFKWLFDHTVVVADDDPALPDFIDMHAEGVIQLRTMRKVGCEMFAQHILLVVNQFLKAELGGRVMATEVRFFENGKNSAIAKREPK